MNQVLLDLLFIFVFSASAEVRMISIIGIDETEATKKAKTVNHSSFYQAAIDFNSLCGKAIDNPKCALGINLHPALTAWPENVKYVKPENLKPELLRRSTALKYIEDQIESAKEGDTIILELTNHGAPTKEAASCIWMNSNENICDSDIKKIIEEKMTKPGKNVRLVISADACMTGAFADLSSKNVCTRSGDSREYVVADPWNSNIWGEAQKKSAKSLSDLQVHLSHQVGSGGTLSSQFILQQLCAKGRSELEKDPNFKKQLPEIRLLRFTEEKEMLTFDRVKPKAFALLTGLTDKRLENLSFPSPVLEALKRLRENQEFKNLGDRLYFKEAELTRIGTEMFAIFPNSGLPDNDRFLLQEVIAYSRKNNPQIPPRLKASYERLKSRWDSFQRALNAADDEYSAIVKEMKTKGFFSDWKIVDSCLYSPSVEQKIAQESAPYKERVKLHPPRPFTEGDLKDVLFCEAQPVFPMLPPKSDMREGDARVRR